MSAVGGHGGAARSQTTYYDGQVLIPGFGDAPERCRPMTPVGFCEHGHPVLGRSSCGNRGCPDHWRDWIEDAVVSLVARVAAYREAREPRAAHVVASPPQGRRYSRRALWETRSEAYDALEAAGVKGGAAVTHPYRTNERADGLYRTARESGDLPESTGKWRFLRDSADEFEDLTGYLEAEPHYHTIAPIGDVDGSDAPGDWVVERIRTFKPFYYQDTEAYRDMASSAYYVLTHAAFQQGRASTTYFGAVHPSTFSPEEELTATKWDRIQREAERAVKTTRDEREVTTMERPEECPRDGCEGDVVAMRYLREYMDDEEWVESIRAGREGRQRWLRLRGLLYWYDEGGDRPPPGVQANEARLLEWLEDQGRMITPESSQVSIATAL